MLSKRLSTMLLSGAAVAGLGASAAQAALFLELRAASVDAAHQTFVVFTAGGKNFSLLPGAVGATLTMNIIAKSSGQDGNQGNDGLLSLAGSFLSTRAGTSPRGNLAASRQVSITGLNQTSGFNGAGGQNGTVTDLNGDGDLDVGSNVDTDSAGFFAARATSAPDPVFGTAPPFELQVGTVRYVVTDTGATPGPTTINFRKREAFGAASWYEDSVQNPDDGTWSGAHTYNSDPNWTIGAPVNVFGQIPEPATLGLASLAGLGLLARRRK
jgi:hypothetical protein